jgi:hypothetical protein
MERTLHRISQERRQESGPNSKGLENSSEYKQLEAAADQADAQAKARRDDIQKQLNVLNQKIQAVQDVFMINVLMSCSGLQNPNRRN